MNNIININGRAIEQVNYKGVPVISMSMVDELHERPAKTAIKAFSRHKKRMEEGKHYYLVPQEEWKIMGEVPSRGTSPNNKGGGYAGNMYFLTQIGYVKLIKVFDDDLSWQIYDLMVENYFKNVTMVSPSQPNPDIKLTIDIGRLAKQADVHLDGITSLRLLNQLTGMPVNDLIQKIEVKGLETASAQLKDAELVAAHLFAVLNGGEFDGIKSSVDDEGRKCLTCTTAVMLAAMEQAGKKKRLPKLGYSPTKLGNFFGRHMLQLEGLGWRRELERMVKGNRFFRYTCLEVEE